MNRFAELCYGVIDGKISREQLDRELIAATFSQELWEESSRVLLEPEMPKELKDYYARDPALRAKIDEPAYLRRFSWYFIQYYDAKLQNENKLNWLLTMKKMITADDLIHHKMLKEAIEKFELALSLMRRPSPPAWPAMGSQRAFTRPVFLRDY